VGTVVGAEFWTDPGAAAATLPDGLTPDPESGGHGIAAFIDWQYSGSRDEYLDPVRSQYREFLVLLDARRKGTPVAWCPPKTFTVANQAAPALGPGGQFAATASAAGYRVANARVTLRAPVPGPRTLPMRPMVNLRHFPAWPRASRTLPPSTSWSWPCSTTRRSRARGPATANSNSPPVPGEELHDLAPRRTGAGFRFELAYTVTDLRTLN